MVAPLIKITYDEAKLQRIQNLLREIPNALPKVVSRGINRTAQQTKTQIVRRVSAETKALQKEVRAGIVITKKATYTVWLSVLSLGGRGIPIIRFKHAEAQRGIIYWLGGKHYFLRHAFLATMPSGHKGVFLRGRYLGKEPKRKFRFKGGFGGKAYWTELPIKERFGPAIGTLFEKTANIAKEITAESEEKLEQNIDSQVRLILEGIRT
jgi:hypothetical protein